MASIMEQAATAIVAALRAVDGTGSYTYDLSDYPTARVQIGVPTTAPCDPPFVFVTDFSMQSVVGPNVPLGLHERTIDVTIYGYASGDGTPEDRTFNAMALQSDVDAALQADRTLGGVVYDVFCVEAVTIDGLQHGADLPYGIVACVYRFNWHTAAGF